MATMRFPCQIRVHPRARHVRLRMDARDGLVVTIPPGFDRRAVPALLAERSDWIEQAKQTIRRQRAGMDPELSGRMPARVELPAVDQTWAVVYSRARRARLDETDGALHICLPDTDREARERLSAERLRAWLGRRARQSLLPRVDALCAQFGLARGRISVRNQRSRWGSCSATGNLSLNMRLLFASPRACRYVLVHELVHTEHRNHSPAFWSRVAELAPDYRESMAELKSVWQRLPDWV